MQPLTYHPNAQGAISLIEAKLLHGELVSMDLAWGYARNGCCARTHLMAAAILARGLKPKKIWAFADDPNRMLNIPDPSILNGVICFGFHVAPTILVHDWTGQTETQVLDPLLHFEPLTIGEWLHALGSASAHVVETDLGQPPLPTLGGTGCQPAGPDPQIGVDAHAQAAIAFFADLIAQNRTHEYHEPPF